mmetsp:Transcript_5760/g.6258  ORF Transcript_5760/g.6258 Transcript_5760/m.6258 type:complete len:403 (-) Transcript_5760:36-1244(-)
MSEQNVEIVGEKRPRTDGNGTEHTSKKQKVDEPTEAPVEEKKVVAYRPPKVPANAVLQGCRSVDAFAKVNRIEEGTFGVVYKAKDKQTGEIVALKKVKMQKEKEGFPLTSLREVDILLKCKHPHIVDVKEIVIGPNINSIYIVMEFLDHDLKALMEDMKSPFKIGEVKTLMLGLLQGLEYLHESWLIHRDIKTSNLLLNNEGVIKICDFGLARAYSEPLAAMSQPVVTLWYRCPELLLGQRIYSTAIDMWSVGCVFAELLTGEPLIPGRSELEQLDQMFKLLGTPNEKLWPGFSKLPNVQKVKFENQPYNNIRSKIAKDRLTETGFLLLMNMLCYNPEKRITAKDAVRHAYFEESPPPTDPDFMQTWPQKDDRREKRNESRQRAAFPTNPSDEASSSFVLRM